MGSLERVREDAKDRQAEGLRLKRKLEGLDTRSRNIVAWRKAKSIERYRRLYLDQSK